SAGRFRSTPFPAFSAMPWRRSPCSRYRPVSGSASPSSPPARSAFWRCCRSARPRGSTLHPRTACRCMVVALGNAFGTPLSVANFALTAYLTAQAFGVLAGGFVADMTRRHAEVAALGYAVNACIVLAIGTLGLPALPLVLAMSAAGLLGGLIMPSRDMLVRAAAPPGAV